MTVIKSYIWRHFSIKISHVNHMEWATTDDRVDIIEDKSYESADSKKEYMWYVSVHLHNTF